MPEIKKEQKAAAPCPLYKKCGGCQLQNLNYEEQLRWKERRMIGLMGQFGHVEPVIGTAASFSIMQRSTGTIRCVLDWYTPEMIRFFRSSPKAACTLLR